ncbi:MAG: hypothetical protein IKC55_00285, partial [Clostridia bacterium]|nr:hypothetical protein [Clostridia bacterium]
MQKDKIRLIGVDAGGTKTDIVLCDGNGHVLGRRICGSGNVNDVGAEACFLMISGEIGELLGETEPDAIFIGASGAISGDGPLLLAKMRERYPETKVLLENLYAESEQYAEKTRLKDVEAELLREEISAIEEKCAEAEADAAVLGTELKNNAESIERVKGEIKE